MRLQFDDVVVDVDRREIEIDGRRVCLSPRVFATLLVLIDHAGHPVSRDQLMAEVWPDAHVVPNSVTQAVRAVRRSLAESVSATRFHAVPGRGYIFDGIVRALPPAEARRFPAKWIAAAVALALIAGSVTGLSIRHASKVRVQQAMSVTSVQRGRSLLATRKAPDLQGAAAAFTNAIAHDPQNAEAFAGLAQANYLLAFYGIDDDPQSEIRTRDAASRAIALNPALTTPYLVRASVALDRQWDLTASARDFQRALTLDPRDVLAQHWSAWWCLAAGMMPEARAAMNRAVEIDPLSPATLTARATFAYLDGDFESALVDARRALWIDPQFFRAHLRIGLASLALGRTAEAIAALETSHALAAQVPETVSALAHAYAISGAAAKAERLLRGTRLPLYDQSIVLTGLGRYAEAVRALVEARRQRQLVAGLFAAEPRLAPLRRTAEFRHLVGELTMSLPEPR